MPVVSAWDNYGLPYEDLVMSQYEWYTKKELGISSQTEYTAIK
jgi:hypothetical protein